MITQNNAMKVFFKEIDEQKKNARKESGKGLIGSSSVDISKSKTLLSTVHEASADNSKSSESEIDKVKVNPQENTANRNKKRKFVKNIMNSKSVQDAIKKINLMNNQIKKRQEEDTDEIEQEFTTNGIKEEDKDMTFNDSINPENIQNSKELIKKKSSKKLVEAKLSKGNSAQIINDGNHKNNQKKNEDTSKCGLPTRRKMSESPESSKVTSKNKRAHSLDREVKQNDSIDKIKKLVNSKSKNKSIHSSLKKKNCNLKHQEVDKANTDKDGEI